MSHSMDKYRRCGVVVTECGLLAGQLSGRLRPCMASTALHCTAMRSPTQHGEPASVGRIEWPSGSLNRSIDRSLNCDATLRSTLSRLPVLSGDSSQPTQHEPTTISARAPINNARHDAVRPLLSSRLLTAIASLREDQRYTAIRQHAFSLAAHPDARPNRFSLSTVPPAPEGCNTGRGRVHAVTARTLLTHDACTKLPCKPSWPPPRSASLRNRLPLFATLLRLLQSCANPSLPAQHLFSVVVFRRARLMEQLLCLQRYLRQRR